MGGVLPLLWSSQEKKRMTDAGSFFLRRCCGAATTGIMKDDQGEAVEGLELCSHTEACTVPAFRLLNRDKNASRNIYRVAECMLKGKPRPAYLQRAKKKAKPRRIKASGPG